MNKPTIKMDYIKVMGLDMYYGAVGAGYPLIFLHGQPADHQSMVSAFEPIFKERSNWQRHYLDLPGMGKTKGADWIVGNDQMLEVVLALIETIIPGQRFAVVGESFGGYLARGLAHFKADQIDGMFLLGASVKSNPRERKIPENRIIYSDPDLPDHFWEGVLEGLNEVATAQTKDVAERLQADYLSAIAASDQPFLKRVRERHAFSFDFNDPPPRYDFPSLILSGRQDLIVGYEDQMDMHRFFPRGSFVVLDRAGHVLELEQLALFEALTGEWLDRVEEYIETRDKLDS